MNKETSEKEEIKLRISETIGELRGKMRTINGEKGQVILDGFSLIEFLKYIQKKL